MYYFIYKDFSEVRKGGAVIAGIKFLNALRRENIEIVSYSYTIGNSKWKQIIWSIFKKSDGVIWNISTSSLPKFTPLIFLSAIFNHKVCVRFFGGDQKLRYLNSKMTQKSFHLLKYFKVLLLLETEENVEFFTELNFKVLHFPNFIEKDKYNHNRIVRKYSKKLLFVGLIDVQKGVNIILEFLLLNNDYECDFYGPLSSTFQVKKRHSGIWSKSYRGYLEYSELLPKFKNYSILLLPSFKEGYPSVVLDSLNQNLPMVLSSLPSLKEMVKDSAKFVELNVHSLEKTIKSIDVFEWHKMYEATIMEVEKFTEDKIIKKFILEF